MFATGNGRPRCRPARRPGRRPARPEARGAPRRPGPVRGRGGALPRRRRRLTADPIPSRATIDAMTDTPTGAAVAAPPAADERPYSPGLEGVVGAESAIGLVDGKNGRLLYRGYRIGQLVERGTYAQVADLLWTGEWHPEATLPPAPVPPAVLTALRELPRDAGPMDALRTAVSVWGATQKLDLATDPRAGHGPSRRSRPRRWRRSGGCARASNPSRPTRRSGSPRASSSSSTTRPRIRPPRGRSTPTSSSAPSTASTPRRSPPGSSPPPAATSSRRSAGRSARSRGRSTAALRRRS